MKSKIKLIAVLLCVAIAGSIVVFRSSSDAADEKKEERSVKKDRKQKKKKISTSKKSRKSAADRKRKQAEGRRAGRRMGAAVSDKDRLILQALDAAQDEENFNKTVVEAQKALKSSNPDVRMAAIDALEWFEDKGLPELVGAMVDANGDVAESARNSVENILMGMDNPEMSFTVSAELISAYRGNKDALTMLSGVLSNAATELIEPSDDSENAKAVAKDNRFAVIETVSEMMKYSESAAEEGREIYESVTGEKWLGLAEAKLWAANPDKYEAPENQTEENE